MSPVDTLLTQSLCHLHLWTTLGKRQPVASCLQSPYALSWRRQGQLYRHLLLFIGRDSSAGVVTGRARNRGSIPGMDKRFISCSIDSRKGQEIYFLFKTPTPTLEMYEPCIYIGVSFTGDGVTANILTSSPKIRNKWSYTSNASTPCSEKDIPVTIRKINLSQYERYTCHNTKNIPVTIRKIYLLQYERPN